MAPARRDNLEFLEMQYSEFQTQPEKVEPSWRHFFEGMEFGAAREGSPAASRVAALVEGYRRYGHLGARVSPLAPPPDLPPELRLEAFELASVPLSQTFSIPGFSDGNTLSLQEILNRLQQVYCGSLGFEFLEGLEVQVSDWLAARIEAPREPLPAEVRRRCLERLAAAEGFERFLHTRFLGKKRFSVEGLDTLIPMLDHLTRRAAETGVAEVALGMAHRGRLNVLANIMRKPLARLISEFEESEPGAFDIEGDVKYHMGYENEVEPLPGKSLRLYLSPNPSHLEAVCPVLEGYVYCRQRRLGPQGKSRVIPILLHGDASFIGQGVVSETLNLSGLQAYATGGTIHVVTNNQVGFTTDPRESRSSRYSSAVARQVAAPVIHVNADDPEAVLWAMELAFDFRMEFARDIVVDLVGYRRYGHNEGDEPAFTQPLLYKQILGHPTAFATYSAHLVSLGVVSAEEVRALTDDVKSRMEGAYSDVHAGKAPPTARHEPPVRSEVMARVDTAVPRDALASVLRALTSVPAEFHTHPKLKRILEQRARMLDEAGSVDWSVGELLAFGTLAHEGHPVRLSGQDCKRGTFSSRHAVLFDANTGAEHSCLRHVTPGQAEVDVINSPLSEMACLGFEFGYSVADPRSLVLWEAQFGDFANGAQVIIDQFLAASEAKWGQTCGLVLLLPHGYEGQGPEHSSGRLERFLQLCGSLNLQVCNVTNPAQLFHLLRRQVKRKFRKPLIVMTPKSLLRHPSVLSETRAFTEGGFSELLVDEDGADPQRVERVLCCSGKIYYDLVAEKQKPELAQVPVIRFEQLYPFPREQFRDILARYPRIREVVWVQEEPKNMGAWIFWRTMMEDSLNLDVVLRYAGRKSAGTTAEGFSKTHQNEQLRILREAFGIATGWESLRNFVSENLD